MNDLDNEQLVIKKSVQLHDEIGRLISELVSLAGDSTIELHDKQILLKSTTLKINTLINEFETNPKLLDSSLDTYITKLSELYLSDESVRCYVGEIIYNISKVRQMKNIIHYFSSDVYLITTIIDIIHVSTDEFSIFMGLLWLCNLSLLPFSLKSIDENLPMTIYSLGLENLKKYHNGSKNQIASSVLLSKLVTRSDCSDLLSLFFQSMVLSYWIDMDYKYKLSYYLTINKILKLKISFTKEELSRIYQCINNDILQPDQNPSNLNLLYSIKILSKLAINYIAQGNYLDVQLIINNLVNDVLLEVGNLDYNLRYAMAKSLSNIIGSLSKYATNYKTQLLDFILSNLQEINDDMNIGRTHTILLTLGYVTLNKNLPGTYTQQLLHIIHKSLFVKIQTINSRADLGNCIRDSSCFIVWSIIKNHKYKPNLTSTNISMLFTDLIKVLVFDKELILKKCSIAVLQELIGRYGVTIFKQENSELLGEFIIKFMEIFSEFKLKPKRISYDVIDLLLDKINLNFLIDDLVDEICEAEETEDEMGICLNKLLTQQGGLVVADFQKYDIQDITCKLVDANRWQFLYYLPDVPCELLADKFSKFEFRHNHNLIKGYLNYLLHTDELSDLDWENIFKITKLIDDDFVSEIGGILHKQQEIPRIQLIKALQNNNISLSHVMFNYQHWTQENIKIIIHIMKTPTVDIEVRKNLIYNLMDNYKTYPIIDHLYDLFDDYTTTVQGDVGSKLRLGMIELIEKHNLMNDEIRLKLIRLSGELMDKIRFSAFKVLAGKVIVENKYWSDLFEFYKSLTDNSEKIEFWKGSCHTFGSFKGNPKIINQSFIELLRYAPSTEDINIWLDFLLNPQGKPTPRDSKLKLMILQSFLKLFQSNYNFQELNYQSLFVRCYNLYIGGTNVTRAIVILQIFYFISKQQQQQQFRQINSKIYQVFSKILNGKFAYKLKLDEIFLQIFIDNNLDLVKFQKIDWNKLTSDDIAFLQQSI
ncbi:alp1 Tubulin-folding cofactor D [Candida maltosa Xu316]|uniref:Cin1-like protein n=1 Tax=Candida maltosa (strain Xu316) TaxID=1245528 RepID=M3HFZ1_CANMX|nr:Cin1-like protein [Candida maltosa Xu316]